MSSRDVLKPPSRRLGDQKRFTGKESLSVSNKSKSVSDKSISNEYMSSKSKANPKQV